MACLEMYNSEHKGHHHHHHHCASVSPRISFSNDFVDSQAAFKQERSTRSDAPVSTDFEFSVTNYSMMSADQLFSKGRLLPFKDNCNNKRPTTTLREELLAGDDDEEEDYHQGFSLRPPKGSSTRWKGFLGLRKSHIGSKKVEKGSSEGANKHNMTSQEMLIEGGSSCRDVEIGI